MIKNELLELKDEKYKEFSSSLLPGVDNMIGVRLPVLRKLSKNLRLLELTDDTFEEVMLQGMVIGRMTEFSSFVEELNVFLPKINNWSICDSFVSSLVITKSYEREMFQILKGLKDSKLEYTKRFILVMLLRYFLDNSYMKDAVELAKYISKDEYYVKMAYSWFIAEVYYRNKKIAETLIDSEKDEMIRKMSLSKIKESNKIKKKEVKL